MTDVEILVRGVIAGLIISAPVGPVNVLCISRSVEKGLKAGLISGLGAAAADTVYGGIAGFSVQFVIGFLLREEFWIRLVGGLLLIGIGIHYYFRKPKPKSKRKESTASHSDFVTAFLLNLTNPTTVLSFLAVLTVLGLHSQKTWLQSLTLVGGIFGGAMLWWITLSAIASRFRGRMTDRTTVWMNRIAGIAIGGFGVVTMAMSRAH